MAVELPCSQRTGGRRHSWDARESARVGSTRELRSRSMLAWVGRRSSNSPAKFTRIEPSSSLDHSPTVRPSQLTCLYGRFRRGDRVSTTTSACFLWKSAAILCPRVPVPPAMTTFMGLPRAANRSSWSFMEGRRLEHWASCALLPGPEPAEHNRADNRTEEYQHTVRQRRDHDRRKKKRREQNPHSGS